jgi:hypothetical protein
MSGDAPGAAKGLMGAHVHGQEDIIRERLTRDRCGACGASRSDDDVLVLAHRSSHWLMLVVCWRCHHRGIFIASFPHDARVPHSERLPLDPALDSQLPPPTHPAVTPLPLNHPNDSPVTSSDVDAMRRFLSGFNGDFHALFGDGVG